MSFSLRNAAVILTATVSFAGLTQAVVPSGALARPNNHAYQRSMEAKKQQSYECGVYKSNYDWGFNQALQASYHNNDEMMEYFAKYANDNRDKAKAEGCSWAS